MLDFARLATLDPESAAAFDALPNDEAMQVMAARWFRNPRGYTRRLLLDTLERDGAVSWLPIFGTRKDRLIFNVPPHDATPEQRAISEKLAELYTAVRGEIDMPDDPDRTAEHYAPATADEDRVDLIETFDALRWHHSVDDKIAGPKKTGEHLLGYAFAARHLRSPRDQQEYDVWIETPEFVKDMLTLGWGEDLASLCAERDRGYFKGMERAFYEGTRAERDAILFTLQRWGLAERMEQRNGGWPLWRFHPDYPGIQWLRDFAARYAEPGERDPAPIQ